MTKAASVTAIVLVAATIASPLASARSSNANAHSLAGSSPFCKAGAAFADGTNILTTPPSKLRTDDAAFKAAQPRMVSLAPSSIRTDLTKIFAFDNGLFTELSKVGWTIAKVPRSVLATWAVSGPKLKPASDKVVGYLDSACGLKLKKP